MDADARAVYMFEIYMSAMTSRVFFLLTFIQFLTIDETKKCMNKVQAGMEDQRMLNPESYMYTCIKKEERYVCYVQSTETFYSHDSEKHSVLWDGVMER